MLILPGDIDFVVKLNRKLQGSTLDWYNEYCSGKYKEYSPWMCYPSVKSRQFVDFENNDTLAVWTSEEPINKLEHYLLQDGNEIISGLYDVKGIPFKLLRKTEKSSPLFDVIFNAIDYIECDSYMSQLFSNLIHQIVILDMMPAKGGKTIATSSDLARGVIFISPYGFTSEIFLAMELCHELAHNLLSVFNSSDPLVKNLHTETFSSLRQTLRPAIQSFHAVLAMTFMKYFLDRICDLEKVENKSLYNLKSKELKKQLEVSVNDICQKRILTETGLILIEDCKVLIS